MTLPVYFSTAGVPSQHQHFSSKGTVDIKKVSWEDFFLLVFLCIEAVAFNGINPFFFPHNAYSSSFLPASFEAKSHSKSSLGGCVHLLGMPLCLGASLCAPGWKSAPLVGAQYKTIASDTFLKVV